MCGCRRLRGFVVKSDADIADVEFGTVAQFDIFDALAIDLGAVGGAQVSKGPGAAIVGKLTMAAGNRGIGNRNVVFVVAAHRHAVAGEFNFEHLSFGGFENDSGHKLLG